MSITREAVEAAIAGWNGCRKNSDREAMIVALTAALPFLAPQPSRSDEERARSIADMFLAGDEPIRSQVSEVKAILAAVRAEATLAEREALAKADKYIAKLRAALEMSGGVK